VRALFTDHDASGDHDEHEGLNDHEANSFGVAVFVLAP
jgi:hypothetical protein